LEELEELEKPVPDLILNSGFPVSPEREFLKIH
jgi:hypothetical protein